MLLYGHTPKMRPTIIINIKAPNRAGKSFFEV